MSTETVQKLYSPTNQRFALPLIILLVEFYLSKKSLTLLPIDNNQALKIDFETLDKVSQNLWAISNYNYDIAYLSQYCENNLNSDAANSYKSIVKEFFDSNSNNHNTANEITTEIAKDYINFVNEKINNKEIFGRISLFDAEFKAVEKIKQEKNREVYHYTSLESGIKILISKSLRAFSVHGMNDPNEMIMYEGASAKDEDINCFIASFSKRKDYLPLWKIYSSDANGIQLTFEIFDNYNENITNNSIYLSKGDVRYIDDKNFENETTDSVYYSILKKHKSYNFEKEHRILVNINNQWNLLTLNDETTPVNNHKVFYELPILESKEVDEKIEKTQESVEAKETEKAQETKSDEELNEERIREGFHLILKDVMLGPKSKSKSMEVLLKKIVADYYKGRVTVTKSEISHR